MCLGRAGVYLGMAEKQKVIATAAQMALMSPQERADAVAEATVRSWNEVPESFKSEVLETARVLGAQRRHRD